MRTRKEGKDVTTQDFNKYFQLYMDRQTHLYTHTYRKGRDGKCLNMASQFTTVLIIVADRNGKMKKTLKLVMDVSVWLYSMIGAGKRQNKGFAS